MSYYVMKKSALRKIDEMLGAGKTDAEIIYKISSVYGFGAKIVKERRQLVKELAEQD